MIEDPTSDETPDIVPDEVASADSAPVADPLTSSLALSDSESLLERILEALLLASDQPLSVEQLQRLLGEELGVGRKEIRAALDTLGLRLADGASELREIASGFRIQVRSEYAQWVSRLWQEKPQKFTRAMLETLALICYRQPITRGEIEDIRGVAVSPNIIRTLLERGWIREVGFKEVPGRPALFATTAQLLDDFNLKSLDQLPALPDIKDLALLDAALAQLTGGAMPTDEDEAIESGEPSGAADTADAAELPAADADTDETADAALATSDEDRDESGADAEEGAEPDDSSDRNPDPDPRADPSSTTH